MRTEWQQPKQPMTRTVHFKSGHSSDRVPVVFIRWTDADGIEIVDIMGIHFVMKEHEMYLEVTE